MQDIAQLRLLPIGEVRIKVMLYICDDNVEHKNEPLKANIGCYIASFPIFFDFYLQLIYDYER